MAEDATDIEDFAEGDESDGGKKFGMMKLIMIAVAAILVLGGGGASYYFMGFSSQGGMNDSSEADVRQAMSPPKPAFYYSMPEITVNLSSAETRATYLRMNISLEFSDKDMIDQMEPHLPRVMDTFQIYLRELRIDDLQGSAGLFRLKEELQRRINLAIYPAKVDDILFKDIKVQ